MALRERCKSGDRIVILAGSIYRQPLARRLREWGCSVDVPMAGLRIGEQLQWLDRKANNQRPPPSTLIVTFGGSFG